jgi:hypothetical protein
MCHCAAQYVGKSTNVLTTLPSQPLEFLSEGGSNRVFKTAYPLTINLKEYILDTHCISILRWKFKEASALLVPSEGDNLSNSYRVTEVTPFQWALWTKQTNSVALSLQANYTDWVTATSRRNLVSSFVDRGVWRGQRGGSPTVINLSFLVWSHYFSFK